MEKKIKQQKSCLINVAICIALQIIANFGVYMKTDTYSLLFCGALVLACFGSFYCYSTIKKDVRLCGQLSMLVGPVVFILCLIDGFCGFTLKLRVLYWISLINGPIIFFNSFKLKQYGSYY